MYGPGPGSARRDSRIVLLGRCSVIPRFGRSHIAASALHRATFGSGRQGARHDHTRNGCDGHDQHAIDWHPNDRHKYDWHPNGSTMGDRARRRRRRPSVGVSVGGSGMGPARHCDALFVRGGGRQRSGDTVSAVHAGPPPTRISGRAGRSSGRDDAHSESRISPNNGALDQVERQCESAELADDRLTGHL